MDFTYYCDHVPDPYESDWDICEGDDCFYLHPNGDLSIRCETHAFYIDVKKISREEYETLSLLKE
jgi:hypothetical protein